ncbi:diguanylate cyclase (GGDEF) domain-containing protein [Halomonas daqiaonensis]|uniref:diguanylate cyclase n=2 Tax=Halomonas daqiaonensis TaxID=650850 RepID=A0A1H7NXL3_9GAMM|nr:diguanylate cyclase (GGDEF) domain-containing protein [Halomonas daqiaonensis]
MKEPSLDLFPCGCMITPGMGEAGSLTIISANRYFEEVLGIPLQGLLHQPLVTLLTRASGIFFDSFMLPMLLHEGRCDEILLDIRTPSGERVPVIVNTVLEASGEQLIYWSLFKATQRNRLDQELISTRSRLEEKSAMLEELTRRDELTGLLNRRELRRRADLILAQSRRTDVSVAVLMLDIDHFKEINDTRGHAEGDRILEALGCLFRGQGREADIIARVGGEEFVFMASGLNEQEAVQAAQRLHELAGQVPMAGDPLTISIGISLSSGDSGLTYQELFKRADMALYEAKSEGRNRTLVYNSNTRKFDTSS